MTDTPPEKYSSCGLETTLRDEAYREYEYCREGIEKYDEHLFRIRQWSIGLTGIALAAIMGVSQTGGQEGKQTAIGSFEPTLALFIFTAISAAFWFLDAFNKSLQTVHIHNSRDIERYLRGSREDYIGPTISLRFQRKEKRHWVATVKNLTDESLMRFHLFPICVFWLAVLFKFREKLCFGWDNCGQIPENRLYPVAIVGALGFLLFLSWIWKHGVRSPYWQYPFSKFFLRPKAAARYGCFLKVSEELAKRKNATCSNAHCDNNCPCKQPYPNLLLPPFRADFYNQETRKAFFIDRCKIFKDAVYLEERSRCIKKIQNADALNIKWEPTKIVRLWRPADKFDDIIDEFLNANDDALKKEIDSLDPSQTAPPPLP